MRMNDAGDLLVKISLSNSSGEMIFLRENDKGLVFYEMRMICKNDLTRPASQKIFYEMRMVCTNDLTRPASQEISLKLRWRE